MFLRKFAGEKRPLAQPQILCPLCGGEIYPGEYYYELDGRKICESCLGRYARRYFDQQRRRLTAAGREDI